MMKLVGQGSKRGVCACASSCDWFSTEHHRGSREKTVSTLVHGGDGWLGVKANHGSIASPHIETHASCAVLAQTQTNARLNFSRPTVPTRHTTLSTTRYRSCHTRYERTLPLQPLDRTHALELAYTSLPLPDRSTLQHTRCLQQEDVAAAASSTRSSAEAARSSRATCNL